jgi:hypothetical protein
MKKRNAVILAALIVGFIIAELNARSVWAQTSEAQSTIARSIGTIKTINGNALMLSPANGPEVAVTVESTARILRMAPGDKDLKNATPIQVQDLKVGDMVRARGHAMANGIDALEIVVISSSTIDAVRDQIRQDWQKRGTGGLVSSVDPAAGTVTISVTGFGGKKDVVVRTAKNTIIRRYAPDSVKFDDAKPSSLAEIHSGDQLRARGEKSADGLSIAADEIVSGSFRNVAGTVNTVDASAGTITVQDLLTKKPIVVKIAAESQLHKLPPEFAQRIAMRLKGSMPPGMPGAGGASTPAAGSGGQGGAPSATPSGGGNAGASGGGTYGGMAGGGMRAGGAPDFQQMLSRMPAVTLADLHKGDAVLVVATEGSASGATAITLLSGVEPILQAAPSASQAMMLTPWSLGGAPGGDAMQ